MEREKQKKCEMFGGKDADAQNALMTAFWVAAEGEENMYEYLDKTPKTSLVVELYNALQEIGYKIVKI